MASLTIGASSTIAQSVIQQLLANGEDVIAISRKPAPAPEDVDVDVDEELGVGVMGGVLPTQAVSASGASKRPKNLYMGISP